VSTDGLIIAASIRHIAIHSAACNREFRDSVSHGRIFRKKRKDTHTYISRMYLCVLHDRHIVRSANVWTMANSDPMNKDQNVCTAIVPSLVTKSTVKCDYGLSQITIERWNFSHRRSNNFSTCLSDNVWKISPIINSDFKTNRQRLGLLLSVFFFGRNFDVKIIKHSYFYNIFLRIKFNFH